MDASMMDAEGGRVRLQERRAKRLVVIVALQNLLVAACLLLTLYAYCVQEPVPDGNNIHIHFAAIADIEGNKTLEFVEVQSNYMMSLDEKKKDEISINCTGPYILYMTVCYTSMVKGTEASGTLQLVDGRKTPEILFSMSTSSEVCTGLHKLVYFEEKVKASLRLESRGRFKLKTVTVGLSCLLGRQCNF